MKSTQILPTVIILISLGSAFVYAANREWRQAIYWLASAVIVTSVTF